MEEGREKKVAKKIYKNIRFHSSMAPTTLIPFITDVNRWKLKVVHGRQTWHYDEPGKDVDAKPSEPQALYEKYFLGSLTVGEWRWNE